MNSFIETISIKEGMAPMLDLHCERLNRTRAEVFGLSDRIELGEHITLADGPGTIKCRVVYGENIESVSYSPYTMRPVGSLMAVRHDDITYRHKSTDRTHLARLTELRGGCDDIIIIRHDRITDTSICNVALFDGTRWLTPSKPLLQGVRRTSLLADGLISECDITIDRLCLFEKIALFNGMIEFGELVLDIGCIDTSGL